MASLKATHSRGLALAIRRCLQREKADLLDFASELIRVPSENPPGNSYAQCAALIGDRLEGLGLAVRRLDPSGTGPNK